MDRSTGSSNSTPLLDQNCSQIAWWSLTTASGAAASASPASFTAAVRGSAASRLVTMATACRASRVTTATAKLMPAQPASPGSCWNKICTSGSGRASSGSGKSLERAASSWPAPAGSIRITLRSARARIVAGGIPRGSPSTTATARRRSRHAADVDSGLASRWTCTLPRGPTSATSSKRFSARSPSSVQVYRITWPATASEGTEKDRTAVSVGVSCQPVPKKPRPSARIRST